MAEKGTAQINTIPGGIWGLMGYRLFDVFMNLASKLHWFFLIYWVPPYAVEFVRELNRGYGTNNNTFNLDVGEIPPLFEGTKTIGVLLAVILFLIVIIVVQRNTLNHYKRKAGRLERGIIDPLDDKRGSSDLTDTGSTNPGDKP